MLKQIAELGLIVQRACRRLMVATAAVSVHSPLFVLAVASSAQQVAVMPVVDDAERSGRRASPLPCRLASPQHPRQQGMTACRAYMLLLTNQTLCLRVMNDTDD